MKIIVLFIVIISMSRISGAQNIVQMEYFFSDDPGYGLATQITEFTQSTTVNFSTTLLAPLTINPGFHTLNIRAKTATGGNMQANRWSVCNSTSMIIFNPSAGTSNGAGINKLEYFFGADPGFGNGISVNINPDINGNVLLNLTIPSSLASGFYMLAYRVRTKQGQWSVSKSVPFIVWSSTVNPNNSLITSVEYFIDFDPGNGFGTNIPFAPNPASFVQTSPQIDLSNLSLGDHILYVRAKDVNNQWSSPKSTSFNISCANGVKLFTVQSGNWTNNETWACGRVPTIADDVFIKSPHKVTLNPSETGFANSIDNANDAVLNIRAGSIFKVK